MTFYVTFRQGKATDTLAIEASDRSELFTILKERAITPIRIEESLNKKPKAKPRASVSYKKIATVFLAMLVIFLLAVAVVIFSDRNDELEETEEKTKQIETVDPSLASDEEADEKDKPLPPQKVGEMRNGYVLLPSGRLHKSRGVITNSVSATHFKGEYEIFDFYCENEIACLLTMKPGETLIGEINYNGRFTREFLESLKTPIIINESDSEYAKELKRNVIAAKEELKAAYDRGADIEKIISETREEFQDLSRYKNEIASMIYEYKSTEGVSEEDLNDYISAANSMLEEKGIAPLELGILSRRKLRLDLIEQRQGKRK